MINWHLSKQGIRWPVSRDCIAGSSLQLIEVKCSFEVDCWPSASFSIGSQAHVWLTCWNQGRIVRKPVTVRTLEPWTPWLYFHFIFTLFVLFFHLFCSYFLYFSRTNQSHLWTEAMAQTFFLFFSVFLLFHATRLRRFSVYGYTCIPNKVGGFFGRN